MPSPEGGRAANYDQQVRASIQAVDFELEAGTRAADAAARKKESNADRPAAPKDLQPDQAVRSHQSRLGQVRGH